MIKVRILNESIEEIILDEAKEDKLYDEYWGKFRHNEHVFRSLLVWIYGRHSGPGQWQGVTSDMLKKFKDQGKKFAPKRQQRIKYLDWGSDMLKIGYTPRSVIDSLKLFEKFSQQFKEKSIKAYESPDAILSAYKQEVVMKRVTKARKGRDTAEERTSEEDRTIVYEDEHIFVIRPHNVEASCHYGRKTKWCIAQSGNDYFKEYTEDEGKVFYFIKDDRRMPDDRYAKVAIQISLDNEGDINFDGFWDRYDNEGYAQEPRNIGELADFFGKEIQSAMRAIQEHVESNPPLRGDLYYMNELDEAIHEGQYNNDNIQFFSDVNSYESPSYISIGSRVSIMIDMEELLRSYPEEEVEEAWEEASDDIYNDFDSWMGMNLPEYPEWNHIEDVIEVDKDMYGFGKFYFATDYPWRNFSHAEEAKTHVEDLFYWHDSDQISDKAEELKDIIKEHMLPILNKVGGEEITKIAKNLWNLTSKLENFEAHYDEEDHDIHFSQKKPFTLPIKVKSFNLDTKGWADTNKKTQAAKEYQKQIRAIVNKADIKSKIELTIFEVSMAANRFAHRQVKLNLPNVEYKPPGHFGKEPPGLNVLIGIPGIRDITGEDLINKPSTTPTIRAGINFLIGGMNKKEDILYTIQYMTFVDKYFSEIYEKAIDKIKIDYIQKQINATYQEIFVADSMTKLKKDAGFGPEAYTESKKRIKIRIR